MSEGGSFTVPNVRPSVHTVTGSINVPTSMLDQVQAANSYYDLMADAMHEAWQRRREPWLFPDKNPMPSIEPFPRAVDRIHRAKAFLTRWHPRIYFGPIHECDDYY